MEESIIPKKTMIDFDLSQLRKKKRLAGILTMMTGYRLRFGFAITSQLIATTCKTSVYLLLAWFIDTWLTQGDRSVPIILVALAFVGLALVEGFFSFSANSQANYVAERIAYRIRNNMYDQIQRLAFAYHARVDTGDLIQRVTSDVDAVRRFFSEQAIGIGRIFFLYLVNFTAIYQLDRQLAFSALMIVPLVFITALYFFNKIGKRYEEFQIQDAKLSTMLQENLTGVRVVKAFARQEYEKEKYQEQNWLKYQLGKRLMLIEAWFWPSTDILCGLQMIFSSLMGAYAAIDGRITLGSFVAFQALLIWIIWPIRNMGRLIVQTSRALISFQRVMEVFNEDQESLEQGNMTPQVPPSGAFDFQNVVFSYEGGSRALDEVSFKVKAGDTVALMGSTGSGKTTLINLLPRFYEYSSGSIKLDGKELNQISRNYLRRHIGIVEQEPFLFSTTIAENIAYGVGRECNREEIIAAAKAAAIHDSIMNFEKGYDTLIGERGVTLSGGQKQRVALARTLLKDPRILILDDATSSVDTDTEVEIRKALRERLANRTTFMIAHRIQSVMHADLILVLDKGKIIQAGTHDDLVQADGVYRRIYQIQTQIELDLEREISGV